MKWKVVVECIWMNKMIRRRRKRRIIVALKRSKALKVIREIPKNLEDLGWILNYWKDFEGVNALSWGCKDMYTPEGIAFNWGCHGNRDKMQG